jgi:hypothetical protein
MLSKVRFKNICCCVKSSLLKKFAHVIAVPKSSPIRLDKLRPISLLSFPAKILEKAVLSSMNDSPLKLVDNEQFACSLHDLVSTHLDSPDFIAVSLTFLDNEKAFDSIRHNLLVKKIYNLCCLNDNCVQSGFILWLKSYLNNRTQSVVFNNEVSDLALLSLVFHKAVF